MSSKRRLSRNSSTLARALEKKLSTQSTSCPASSSRPQRCEPKKPEPPVTRTRLRRCMLPPKTDDCGRRNRLCLACRLKKQTVRRKTAAAGALPRQTPAWASLWLSRFGLQRQTAFCRRIPTRAAYTFRPARTIRSAGRRASAPLRWHARSKNPPLTP